MPVEDVEHLVRLLFEQVVGEDLGSLTLVGLVGPHIELALLGERRRIDEQVLDGGKWFASWYSKLVVIAHWSV
jgi:hypothetical protein